MQKVVRLLVITLVVSTLSLSVSAQETTPSTEAQIAQLQADLTALRAEMEQSKEEKVAEVESAKEAGFYAPKFYGALMAAFNVGTYSGTNRFNVRNSRFGFKGNVAKELSYKVQIDFHNQGSVSVLDSYLHYKHNNFGFKLGQQSIMISEDMKRGPADALFASRAFTAIASTAYLSGSDGNYSLKNLGSRDIGAYADYTLRKESAMPINIGLGVFNGSGANNAEWDHSLNLSTRVILGNMKSGFSGGGSLYCGRNNLEQYMTIWTAEARYVSDDLFVETTLQERRLQHDDGLEIMHTANVQGYYNIKLRNDKIFKHIAPTLRWDVGQNMEYIVEQADGGIFGYKNINVHRLTPALNFQFAGSKLNSRLFVGYEFVFTDMLLTDMSYNELMQDKFTIALICAF